MFEQIENGLTALALHITVMLDGGYSKEDIENIHASYDKQLKLANEAVENYQNEETQLEQELDIQDVKRSELQQYQADCKVHLKQQKSALQQYQEAYHTVLTVLEHLSIPESRLFTDEPKASLDQILANLNEQLRQSERSA